jgi:hypothetical protein
MSSFNKLLLENYYNSISEASYSPTATYGSYTPPPPNPGNIPPGFEWNWETGEIDRIIPPDLPDEITIEDVMDPRQVEPGDITMHGRETTIPPRPEERPGRILILVERRDANGMPIYSWEYIDAQQDESIVTRILNGLRSIWRWFPSVGWVLFSPFERQAGAPTGPLELNPEMYHPWNFGWWWDPVAKKWTQGDWRGYPMGNWPNLSRTRDTMPMA